MNADELTRAHLAYRKYTKQISKITEVIGLPHVPPGTIQILYTVRAQEANLKQVADTVGVTPQAVGKMLKEAIKAGLVTVTKDHVDHRAKTINITPAGMAVWTQFEKLVETANG